MNTEYGWVIENAESEPSRPLYFAGHKDRKPEGPNAHNPWSYDNLDAIRFARKEDAENMGMQSEVRICEHAWG